MKLLKLLLAQNYGAYAALQRQAIFGKALYPQFITWNPTTWKPGPTPKTKLIPWFSMSLILFGVTLNFLYIAIHEVIAFEKDPDMGSTQSLMLVFYICANVIASAAVLTYAFKVEEICFVLRNLLTIRNVLDEDGKYLRFI